MLLLDTPNLLTTSPPANTSRPANTETDSQSGSAFGAVLANQQLIEEVQLVGVVQDNPALESAKTMPLKNEKSALDKKPASDSEKIDTPPDTYNTLLAMLQPLQELRIAPTQNNTDEIDASKPHLKHSKLDVPVETRLAAKTELSSTAVVTQGELGKGKATLDRTDAMQLEAQKMPIVQTGLAPLVEQAASPLDTLPLQTLAPFTASVLWQANAAIGNTPVNSNESIATPLGSDTWADDFSQKISWMMTSKQEQIAKLHLNPPDLGPLEIVLKISDSQATALFTSPHSAVREAVENALPKLREILADNGITLGNTTVSDQSSRDGNAATWGDSQSPSQNARWPAPTTNLVELPAPPSLPSHSAQRHLGRVDTFA